MKTLYEKGDKIRIKATGKTETVEVHAQSFYPPIHTLEGGMHAPEEVELAPAVEVPTTRASKVRVVPDAVLQALAQEAHGDGLHYASNLCGVAHSFAEVMRKQLAHPQFKGTDAVNQSPITKLWLDKMCSLAHLPQASSSEAWDLCRNLAAGYAVEFEVIRG